VAPATTAGTTAPAPASSSSLSPTIWVVLFLAAAVLAFAWVRRRRPVGS
jgi:MYXO-CTERM domain-containing protein